jgi:oligosaccharide repeat unit polymerase
VTAARSIGFFLLAALTSIFVEGRLSWPIIVYVVLYLALISWAHRRLNLFDLLNPVSAFVAYYVLLLGLGLALLARWQGVSILAPVIYIDVLIWLGLFLVGAAVARRLLRGRIHTPVTRRVIMTVEPRYVLPIGIAMLTAGLMFTVLFFVNSGGVPILEGETARVTAMESQGVLHRLSYAMLQIGSLLLILGLYPMRRRTLLALGLAVIVILALINAGTGPRAQPLRIVLVSVVALWYLRFGIPRVKHLALLVVGLVVLVGALGYVRGSAGSASGISAAYVALQNRLSIDAFNYQRVIDNVPATIPYMNGTSLLIDLNTYLPGHQPNLGSYLKRAFGVHFEGGGITPTILGELYLNWGRIGVLIGSLVLGFLLQWITALTLRPEVDSWRFLLLLTISFSWIFVVSSGVTTVVLSDTVPLLLVFAVAYVAYRVSSPAGLISRFTR